MVTILLATYNGEAFLAEQIESILSQTETDWQLLMRDDGSTDDTEAIAQKYATAYPDKIRFFRCGTPSGSSKSNFFALLAMAESEYCMICDQDDVWLPQKIDLTLRRIQDMEKRYGVETPLLVHTDLRVVDAYLHVLAESLFSMQDLNPRRDRLNQLLTQNIVTGCTMMVNHSLLGKLQSPPAYAIMHDWWLALVAAAFGQIGFLREPTILYRQHGANQVGAKRAKSLSYKWRRFRDKDATRKSLQDTCRQAGEFLRRYESELSEDTIAMLKAFAQLPQKGKLKRICVLFRYGFWKSGLTRRIGQILFV